MVRQVIENSSHVFWHHQQTAEAESIFLLLCMDSQGV